ncbi:hypothetical protein DOTSEDRAFT_71714 [Dothistroma septosporum NZE10]|uniref:C2H2-type domain-containing protein n=1 Tax=Dothistroma septosporum (strain NZE10 / CBS 128990) TaxID=675120 RepID=N1PKG4_DOTSN|nr:hypothetical protein DOTSEDRAFT_71714 [Dothistroma septosporum NZE10]
MDNYNPGYNPYPPLGAQNLAPQSSSQQQQQQQNSGQPQQQQPNQQHGQQPRQQSNGLSNFGGLSNHGQQGQQQAQQQQQPGQSPSHPTLPPLQGQNGYPQFGNMSYAHPGSQSHTPTTPHAPAQATMNANGPGNYSQHVSPTTTSGPGSMLPPSFPNNPYSGSSLSQSMMYPASTATSMPGTSATIGLPNIRPMPPGGVAAPNGLPSLAGAGQLGQMGQQPSFMQSEEQPTHVVGSQGRRGILPSAPGRPNPPAQGSAQATKSMIPQKDADGKYPCPHCNKTYLHAKHLKRHLLRHTGDRPYMCHLCKDTFSRSDILKRHFQKCSLRRGNPTGANHLAHQRRNTNNGNRLSISQQESPIGLAGMQPVAGQEGYNGGVVSHSPTVNGDMSARSSRANSLITPDQMNPSSAPYQPGMNAYAMQQNSANGTQMPNYSYSQPPPPLNGYNINSSPYPPQQSFLGQQSSRFDNSQNNQHQQMQSGDGSGVDWTRMFNQGGQDGFIGSHSANASSQGNTLIKTEPDAKPAFQNDFSNDSFLGSLYSHPSGFGGEDTDGGMPGFPSWGMDDPLQAKVDNLMQHCFPPGVESIKGNPSADLMQSALNVENIKHYAEHYTSYHGHWPILHMPTFKLAEANNSLVLAIICIGAVYSPKLTVHQSRQMMEFVKATVFGNCSIYSRTMRGQIHGLGSQPHEIEELQALSMLHILFTWHGDPAQRQAARAEFPTLVSIAKAMGLCQQASPGHYAYSALHLSQAQHDQFAGQSWQWQSWLEQEKRNRILYHLVVTDAAMVMYFNCTTTFDAFEIRLMLPADDAAWDASSPQDCANALGLNGRQAQGRNMNGTRKAVQPSFRDAMRTLMDPYSAFQPGSTNVYSKFLLVHALIVRIIACQKALLQNDQNFQGFNLQLHGSTPATPLSQNDWLEHNGGGSANGSANDSGRGTPTGSLSPHNPNAAAHQEKKRVSQALEKWKRNWDHDMELQYPPQQSYQRRFGFSRDGVHFFYLGRSFLTSQQATDFNLPADMRFKRVMSLLKRIKGMVVGDNETKGQEIGSVGDIDDQYGTDSLTLNMELLFKPYNSQLDSPVAGVQTT